MPLKTIATLCCSAMLGTGLMTSPVAAQISFEFELIADKNTPAPGSGVNFNGNFSEASVNDHGNVAFEADTRPGGPGTTLIEGAWANINGSLVRIMDEATPLPGLPGTTFSNLDDHTEIVNGQVAFQNAFSPASIAVSDGLTTRIVAQEGVTTLPGGALVTDLARSEGWGFDGVRTAFLARFDSGRGVYLENGAGGISTIADTSDLGYDGTSFTLFEDAMPDTNGAGVVFMGNTMAPSPVFQQEAIYLFDGTSFTDIATPETAGLLLTDPVNNLISFDSPDIDNGRVVFEVNERTSSNPINRKVVLYDSGTSTYEIIADLSTVLPGGFTPTDFSGVGIAGDYVGFQAVVNGSDAHYLWRDGTFFRVLGQGDVIDGIEIAQISATQRTHIADGYLALQADLTDGSEAIIRVSFVPEPNSLVLGAVGLGGLLMRRRRI